MPTWGEELKELHRLQATMAAKTSPSDPAPPSPFDVLRRTYLARLTELTGRAIIVYASAWLETGRQFDSAQVSVGLGDMQGFMEACSGVEERELDLFLHSPGGSAEAAESIVEYLRTQFDHIRVIVPVAAMSAATMIALSADEILMGAHSQLGPIDPQFTISTPEGARSAPGQAILDQFELAKAQCSTPANIGAWLPILRSYAPGLIALCTHQREMAEACVAGWLERFMFKGEEAAKGTAGDAARWFADFQKFQSHARRVSRDQCRELGLRVVDLEADQNLQEAVLSVFHAFQHTLSGTLTSKILENHHGRAWVQSAVPRMQVLQTPASAPPSAPRLASQAQSSPGPGNRAARRQALRKGK